MEAVLTRTGIAAELTAASGGNREARLGATTRDRAAVQSTVTKAPVGLWLARGSQRLGMSTVVAVSCNPYEESKEHGRLQAAKKSPVGSFLVFGSQPVGMSKRGGSRFDPCENCKRMSL